MSLRNQATSGLVWSFTQQFGNQLIGFVISIVLARLLLPEEFGLIGMIAVFVSIGNALINSGLSQSLIRSKSLDQEDFSTVFFFNLFISALIYILIYFGAPVIGDFYSQPILTSIVRLYCITFIIDAFSAIQRTRMTKNMDFKTQSFIHIPTTIVGGIVGIVMAFKGFGVWSLVWSNIVVSMGNSISYWWYSKWYPELIFNWSKFKDHFNFGYKLTLSSLLNKIFNNIYLIIIGRFFTASQVGFYTRAETMKQLPVTNLSNALNKVTFPLFASIQDDNIRLKRVYKQLMQMVIFVIAPILIFMAILAEPTFRFLFTEKWLPAVPYFQILCATGILYPIHAYNLNVLKVKGRSDLFLKVAVVKKAITIVGIIIGIQFGITGLLYAQLFLSFIAFFINAHYTNKFIKYTALEQIKDILPICLLALVAGGTILVFDGISFKDLTDLPRILIGGLIGTISYLLCSIIFKIEGFYNLKKLVLKKL